MDFNFTTTGKSGDRIYGMPVVRHFGKGKVHGVAPHEISFYERQPYIVKATVHRVQKALLLWGYSIPGRIKHHIKRIRPKETLVESHFSALDLEVPSIEKLNNHIIPWITADKLNTTLPLVINRTFRYRNNVNWSFLKKFKGKIFCIGYWKEVKPFIKNYQAKWLKAKNLDELATIINSCQVFIGNQSTPLALASGLGKNRAIEECHPNNILFKNTPPSWWVNCTFGSKNEKILTSNWQQNYLKIKTLLNI